MRQKKLLDPQDEASFETALYLLSPFEKRFEISDDLQIVLSIPQKIEIDLVLEYLGRRKLGKEPPERLAREAKSFAILLYLKSIHIGERVISFKALSQLGLTESKRACFPKYLSQLDFMSEALYNIVRITVGHFKGLINDLTHNLLWPGFEMIDRVQRGKRTIELSKEQDVASE
jgi:hypothetical protein